MLSGYVVPVEPVCHVFGKLGSRFINVQVDSFILQRAPEPFYKDVIPETPFAVHADPDVPGLENGGEFLTGKLAPWSVLKISGAPYLNRASLSASTQNRVIKILYGSEVLRFGALKLSDDKKLHLLN